MPTKHLWFRATVKKLSVVCFVCILRQLPADRRCDDHCRLLDSPSSDNHQSGRQRTTAVRRRCGVRLQTGDMPHDRAHDVLRRRSHTGSVPDGADLLLPQLLVSARRRLTPSHRRRRRLRQRGRPGQAAAGQVSRASDRDPDRGPAGAEARRIGCCQRFSDVVWLAVVWTSAASYGCLLCCVSTAQMKKVVPQDTQTLRAMTLVSYSACCPQDGSRPLLHRPYRPHRR